MTAPNAASEPQPTTVADTAWWHRRTHADDITDEQLRAEADFDPRDWQ